MHMCDRIFLTGYEPDQARHVPESILLGRPNSLRKSPAPVLARNNKKMMQKNDAKLYRERRSVTQEMLKDVRAKRFFRR